MGICASTTTYHGLDIVIAEATGWGRAVVAPPPFDTANKTANTMVNAGGAAPACPTTTFPDDTDPAQTVTVPVLTTGVECVPDGWFGAVTVTDIACVTLDPKNSAPGLPIYVPHDGLSTTLVYNRCTQGWFVACATTEAALLEDGVFVSVALGPIEESRLAQLAQAEFPEDAGVCVEGTTGEAYCPTDSGDNGGGTSGGGDLNGDGAVNVQDVILLVRQIDESWRV